jgi:hypothetical protein
MAILYPKDVVSNIVSSVRPLHPRCLLCAVSYSQAHVPDFVPFLRDLQLVR